MAKDNRAARLPMQPQTPIIGQKPFLDNEDLPAGRRLVPEGSPAVMALALLYKCDKEQLDRIEQKLDRLLAQSEPPASAGGPGEAA